MPRGGAAPAAVADAAPLRSLAELERLHIRRVLAHTGAAVILGLKPSTLQSRMKKLGLVRRP